MKISSGVEWASHACALLAALPPGKGLRADAMARYHELPPAYLAKQLQALSKAGLIASSRGASGGYHLAKEPSKITLWDITEAIEGKAPLFRCSEIRQKGPCKSKPSECKKACPIAASFYNAETAFRDALKAIKLADIAQQVAADASMDRVMNIGNWYNANMNDISKR